MRDERDDKGRQMEEQSVVAKMMAMRKRQGASIINGHRFKLSHSGRILSFFFIPLLCTDVIGHIKPADGRPWKGFHLLGRKKADN